MVAAIRGKQAEVVPTRVGVNRNGLDTHDPDARGVVFVTHIGVKKLRSRLDKVHPRGN